MQIFVLESSKINWLINWLPYLYVKATVTHVVTGKKLAPSLSCGPMYSSLNQLILF